MIQGLVIGLVVGCLLGVFVTSLSIEDRSDDKYLERAAYYLRECRLKNSKAGNKYKYIGTEKPA